ncbi:PucR family transcriptional regulator [Pseudarthrobacter sp. 1C304]|uniref:PucR family transcriptional regulator n=1 Tax=Pseudarthrobacter sp. 1C304 TaxID=3457438 RepID=UPI003FD29F4E
MNVKPSSTPDSPAYDPPWLALPREVSDVLRPMMPGIVEAIIDAVPQLVPAYARPIEGRFGRGLRRGVAAALDRFLQLPATRLPALSEESRQLVAGLGSGEFRQGRSMDALLSAYRMGARVTFREMSRVSVEHHLGQSVVVDLGESILAYIDELSAVSAEAYAFEQSERAGAVDRRRTELLDLLLRGQADEAALRQKAAMADWSLPQRMAVVTLPVDRSAGLRLRLGPGTLVIERETDAVALVPARKTKSARADLDKALRGRGAAVGPAGGWEKVPDRCAWRCSRPRCCRPGRARTTRPSGPTSTWPKWSWARNRPPSPNWPTAGWHPWKACGRPSGSGWRRPYCPGCATGASARRSPQSSGSTRRPWATGRRSCGSCSAKHWRIPRRGLSWNWRSTPAGVKQRRR